MKNKSLIMIVAILIIAMNSIAQTFGTFTDSRGSGIIYKTVKIGIQTWMAENLKFNTNYLGDINGTDCWCNTIADEGVTYGCLYTYYAAKNYACPRGWKLPSETDWNILIDYLGGEEIAGDKLKDKAWADTVSANSSGFTALPGGSGQKDVLNSVINVSFGSEGYWWTSTPDKNFNIYYIGMSTSDGSYGRSIYKGRCTGGIFSVRCIKE